MECIKIVPIFNNLSDKEMMEVASITFGKNYKKGEMVYINGEKKDKLYVIHRGKVKITRFTPAGKEQVIRILGPGEFMGELDLFGNTNTTDNAEALEDVDMCIINGNDLKRLLIKYPHINFKIMEELSNRLERAENLIENISLNSVEKRLAKTLLNMKDDKGNINLNMSKRDLASIMGMSQETLSRKLKAFVELGIIKQIGHRKIIILNEDALEEIK